MPQPLEKKLASGKSVWRVRFRDNGKSTSATFNTKRDAQWFCDQISTHSVRFALKTLNDLEAERGTASNGPTLDEVAKDFFEWKGAYLRSQMTLEAYRKHYAAHISPTLGKYDIERITPADVSSWVDAMVSGKVANTRTGKVLHPKTIRERHALLHQIMSYASDPSRRIIEANPCTAKVHLPKKIKAAPKGLMPAQWQALHRTLVDMEATDAADLAAFLIGSGWRIGEAMALTVAGVEDYGSKGMWVTMNRVARRMQGQTVYLDAEGKAQKSIRRIRLDLETAEIVRARCMGKRHDALVFTNGDKPWQHHSFRHKLDLATEKVGLPHVTAHWFRHTHVAWLAMAGAPLPELQNRIGHANIQTTIGVYGSMIGDVKHDVLDAFSRMRDESIVTTALDAPVVEGELLEDAERAQITA